MLGIYTHIPMIVMDTTDFLKKLVVPASSPIGSSLSGKSQDEVEAGFDSPPRLGNNVNSKGKGLEQINTKLEKLLVKPKRKPKNIKFTL